MHFRESQSLLPYSPIPQTTGSLYFWAAHLAGPKWGPFASWCCAWLETIGLIAGIGTQVSERHWTVRAICMKRLLFILFMCFPSLPGLCRITGYAEYHFTVHWNQQRWGILCSEVVVFMHVYWADTDMGCAQHICLGGHCHHWHDINMVAGKPSTVLLWMNEA